MKIIQRTVQQLFCLVAITGSVMMTSCSSDDDNNNPPANNTNQEGDVKALKAIYEANPEAQESLGWDLNETDLSKWRKGRF